MGMRDLFLNAERQFRDLRLEACHFYCEEMFDGDINECALRYHNCLTWLALLENADLRAAGVTRVSLQEAMRIYLLRRLASAATLDQLFTGHFRALLPISRDPATLARLLEECVQEHWSVHQTRTRAKVVLNHNGRTDAEKVFRAVVKAARVVGDTSPLDARNYAALSPAQHEQIARLAPAVQRLAALCNANNALYREHGNLARGLTFAQATANAAVYNRSHT